MRKTTPTPKPKAPTFDIGGRRLSVDTFSPPWKTEYGSATAMTIEELAKKSGEIHGHVQRPSACMVSVVGFAGGFHRLEALPESKEGEKLLKFLLYSGYKWNKPVPPAVMLFFRPPFWNIGEYPGPVSLGEGVKLKVYGSFFSLFSKKKGYAEPAITVKYCESSTHSSPWGSRSGSPSPFGPTPLHEQGTKTSPKGKGAGQTTGLPQGSLQEMVYSLLSNKVAGVWERRLAKEYQAFFHEAPPSDLIEKTKTMSFIKWEEIVEGNPILYLKDECCKDFKPESAKSGEDRSVKPSEDKRAGEDARMSEAKKTRPSFTGEKDTPASKRGRSEPPHTSPSPSLSSSSSSPGSSTLGKPSAIPSKFDFSSSSTQHKNQSGWAPNPSLSGSSGAHRDGRGSATSQNTKEGVFVFSARSSSAPATPTSPPSSRSRSPWMPRRLRTPFEEKPTVAVAEKTSPPPLPSTMDFSGSGEEGEIFEVATSFISSPFSFFVQLTGEHYEKFQQMEKEMNDHFSKEAKQASSVEVDQLCACCWDGEEGSDGDQWCRALVLSKQDSQMVDVMFPDYGNSETLNVKDLKELPHSFYQLPFQAIHCCLHGLTEEDDSDKVYEKLYELAADKVCILHVMESAGSRVSVELVDPDSGDETINSILMKTFHPVSTLAPQLPAPGSPPVDVKLTNVDDHGVISLQVVGPGLNRLQQLMTHINETCSKKPKAADFVKKVTEGMVCCAKFHADNQWYRVKVVNRQSENKGRILVEYVDFGNEESVERLKMRKAPDIELFSLPFQAVKCTLAGLPPPEGQWMEEAVAEVVECLNREDLQMVVVQPATDNSLASVQILLKEEEACFNDYLLSEGTLFGLPGEAIPEETAEEHETLEFVTPDSSSVSSHHSQGSYSDGGLEEPPPSPETDNQEQGPGTENQERGPGTRTEKQERSPGRREERNGKGGDPEDVGLAAKLVGLSLDGDGESSDSISGYDTAAEVLPPSQNGDGKAADSEIERRSDQTSKAQVEEEPLPAASAVHRLEPPVTEPRCTDKSSVSVASQDHQQVAVEPQQTAPEPHVDGALNTARPSHSEVKSQTHLLPSTSVQSPNAPFLSPHTPHTPHTPTSSPRSQSPSRLSPAPGGLVPFTPPFSPPTSSPALVPRTPSQSSSASEGARELQYEALQPGKTVPVVVSWVASPSAFVIQVLSKLEQLEELMEVLNKYAESSRSFPAPADIVPGFICSANSGIDKRWYRAVVTALQLGEGDSPKEVHVQYLDYGGTEAVTLSQLRPLPSALAELPVQGIHASLHGVRPTGSGWSMEAAKYFEERVVERQFFAIELKRASLHSVVVLVDTSDGKDTLIHEELIKGEYAINVTQ